MRPQSLREAVAKTGAKLLKYAAKVTLSTAKALVKKYAKDLTTEVSSRDITIWFEEFDDRPKANKAMKAIVKEIEAKGGEVKIISTGTKHIIYYKDLPEDKGDWNDPGSRWHY
jgi:hypothetical protein